MFIHHNGLNISFEADKNSYIFKNLVIWVKGYFFIEDKYYQASDASFLYSNISNSL